METLRAIQERRSIKKFLDIPVEQDKLGILLEAGKMAPSAGNIQDWRFIVIRNKDTIEGVARACLNQMWIARAPAMIVVGSKHEKSDYYYREKSDFFTTQTCSAAAMSMILAAQDIGLSSTWVSAFNEDELKDVLGMPGNVKPHVVIPLGYGDEIVPLPPKYNIEYMTYLERWGNKLKDADWTLQNYNYLGRAIDKGEGFFTWISNVVKDIISKFQKDKAEKEYAKSVENQEIPEEMRKAKEEIDTPDKNN